MGGELAQELDQSRVYRECAGHGAQALGVLSSQVVVHPLIHR
jgi:hypothetical protein